MDKPMGEREEIDINQLRSSYAVRVAKVQEEAFKELNKQLRQIINDIIRICLKSRE